LKAAFLISFAPCPFPPLYHSGQPIDIPILLAAQEAQEIPQGMLQEAEEKGLAGKQRYLLLIHIDCYLQIFVIKFRDLILLIWQLLVHSNNFPTAFFPFKLLKILFSPFSESVPSIVTLQNPQQTTHPMPITEETLDLTSQRESGEFSAFL
jgi:hypothetical protein